MSAGLGNIAKQIIIISVLQCFPNQLSSLSSRHISASFQLGFLQVSQSNFATILYLKSNACVLTIFVINQLGHFQQNVKDVLIELCV